MSWNSNSILFKTTFSASYIRVSVNNFLNVEHRIRIFFVEMFFSSKFTDRNAGDWEVFEKSSESYLLFSKTAFHLTRHPATFSTRKMILTAKNCIWFFAIGTYWTKLARNWLLIWFVWTIKLSFPQSSCQEPYNKVSTWQLDFVQVDLQLSFSPFIISSEHGSPK